MFNFFKKVPSISVTELEQQLKHKLVLLDVRTASEYQTGHIPVAKNVPLNTLSQYQQSSTEPIYLICQSGMRSKQAARILSKKGYEAVNVRGGMSQWQGKTKGGK